MTECTWSREQFALLFYGELSFDQEERVEAHLDRCAACRAALERERALHAALGAIEVEPSPSLLRRCREDLRTRLMNAAPPRTPWWESILPQSGLLRPVGALTLVAIGFFAARLLPSTNLSGIFNTASAAGQERVRYVEPAGAGRVQIVVDVTRQRVISGRADEAPIYALEHDHNAGVREKALSGLAPYAADPEVRNALTAVLLGDSNPGLRTKAIDLLTRGDVDREVVGTLQELMVRGEQLGYVRERCLRVLRAVNASAETY